MIGLVVVKGAVRKNPLVFDNRIAKNMIPIAFASPKYAKTIGFRPPILRILDRGLTLKSAVCKNRWVFDHRIAKINTPIAVAIQIYAKSSGF